MDQSFRSRSLCLDDISHEVLQLLVDLGGYCTAQQASFLLNAGPGQPVRARLRGLQRLGFLRRVSKYPAVYQVTKATTRLLGRDSSIRRRHTLETIQSRLLGVHFYLEVREWPARFVFDHQDKIAVCEYVECPLSLLPQRDGKPYLRENFLFWLPDWRVAIAMVDQPGPGEFVRLRVFLRQFLPLLRSCRDKIVDLFIVTPDQRRSFAYQKLLQRSRAIHKLGVGPFLSRVKPHYVKPPVPTIIETIWPTTDKYDESADLIEFDNLSDGHSGHKNVRLIGE